MYRAKLYNRKRFAEKVAMKKKYVVGIVKYGYSTCVYAHVSGLTS